MYKQKKGLILTVLAIISLVAITIGVTYAFFNYVKEGTTENTITTGTITFLYTETSEVGRGIMLKEAYPISDGQGKSLTGEGNVFDFKITSSNTLDATIPYEITARKKSDSSLPEEAVRIYLTKVNGTEEEVLLDNYSELDQTDKVASTTHIEKTLYKGKVPANEENYNQEYRLRMWVDEDVDFSPDKDGNYPYNNKTFTVTINVYANAKVVTDEEIENASKAEISSLSVEGTELTKVEDQDYDYETTLPDGTTETTIDIETDSPDATVRIERLDSLAYSSYIKRLSTKKTLELTPGDNYFKITVISENKKVENEFTLKISVIYLEALLNGAYPVLTDNLVPVVVSNNGAVTKANLQEQWYDYETKKWANAIVLKDTSIIYEDGDTIPESNIESYFVWIPKYSYQLWDLGNYSSLTSVSSNEQPINIRFGLTNTNDSNTGECTTPNTAGSSGSCSVGYYMTHPAFLSFDSNGFWVGKFETGNSAATSSTDSILTTVTLDNLVVKPNQYSWRNINIGNMFKLSYEYLRNEESHMMKNTEWGAVAYLSHSIYGTCAGNKCSEIRINNNSGNATGYASTEIPTKGYSTTSIDGNRYENPALTLDGTYTINYKNSLSTVASTTQNYTGIYDVAGGSHEYIMGYSNNATTSGNLSEITNIYGDFFTNSKWNKYYDKYYADAYTNYNNRILGDATGELGLFGNSEDPDKTTRSKSSWYVDRAYFAFSSSPWFIRGGASTDGSNAGAFAFGSSTGEVAAARSFRIVLAPIK